MYPQRSAAVKGNLLVTLVPEFSRLAEICLKTDITGSVLANLRGRSAPKNLPSRIPMILVTALVEGRA